MHQEEQLMLGKFILDPALAVSVVVEDLQRNQSFRTQSLFCLASKYATKVPNSSEKEILRKDGLGVRKFTSLANLRENADEVFKKICCGDIGTVDDEGNFSVGYPKLADCGEFELMVSQSNSCSAIVFIIDIG